jgi:hypothetical protein
VRQASGVLVDVGRGEGEGLGWGVEVRRIAVEVGGGWSGGEQAAMIVRSMSSVAISFA